MNTERKHLGTGLALTKGVALALILCLQGGHRDFSQLPFFPSPL
jgi:hypothetical protein